MEATVLPSDLPASSRRLSAPTFAEQNPSLEHFVEWVRENQFPAMIGAFAVGVFLGVLARR